jgi:hypothetical protein
MPTRSALDIAPLAPADKTNAFISLAAWNAARPRAAGCRGSVDHRGGQRARNGQPATAAKVQLLADLGA